MSLKKTIIRNVFSNWVSYLITALVTIFISPFVVHTLGDTGYGIWVLAGSITGYLGLLSFGFPPAIVKFISRFKALEDNRQINEVINTMLAAFTVIGAIALVVSCVLAIFSPKIFVVDPDYNFELLIVIIIFGVNIAISFPFITFDAMINAFQRFDINNIIRISVFLLRTAFIVLFLKMGGGLIALALIALGAVILQYLIQYNWAHKIFTSLKVSFKFANRKTLKMIASFSVYTFIVGISSRLTYYTDSIVIGSFISAGAITYFAIGSNLISYLMQLISNISVVMTPLASSFDAKNDFEKLRQLLYTGTRYSLIVILPIGLTFMVLGENFINLWMGPEYGPDSGKVLRILMISYFGMLSQLVTGSIFLGLGKIKWFAIVNLSQAVANLILSIILVKPYGIFGVAWGTTIPQIIYGTFFLPVYICRELKISLLNYIKKSFIAPLAASVPFFVILVLYQRYLQIDTMLKFLGLIAAACVVYALSGFCIGFEPEHRKIAIEKLKSLSKGFGK